MNKEDELYNSLAASVVRENSLSVSTDWKPWEDSSEYEYVIMLRSFEDCSIDEETFSEMMNNLRRILVSHITKSPLYIIDFNSETSPSAFKDFVFQNSQTLECQFSYFGLNIPKHYSPYQIILLLNRIKEIVSNNYEGLPLLFFKRNGEGSYKKVFEFPDFQSVLKTFSYFKKRCKLQLSSMGYSVEVASETVNKVIGYIEKLKDLDFEYNEKILSEAQARGDYDGKSQKYDRDKPLSEQYVQ